MIRRLLTLLFRLAQTRQALRVFVRFVSFSTGDMMKSSWKVNVGRKIWPDVRNDILGAFHGTQLEKMS